MNVDTSGGLDRAMKLRSSINIGQPNIDTRPPKSIGGALSSAMGGAGAGAGIATALGASGPIGLGVGALIGGASYFMS